VAIGTILVISGVDQGTRLELSSEPIRIGRGMGSQCRLADTEISRQHAEIHEESGSFFISDMSSSNGTFVNGLQIRYRELHDGDRIQCGRSVLLFNVLESDESKRVADQVDFLAEKSPQDRSSIVGKLDESAVDPGNTRSTSLEETDAAETLSLLQALYRITEESVGSTSTLDRSLSKILDLAIEAVGADRGCLLIADSEEDDIVPRIFSHGSRKTSTEKMPVSRSIVNYVLENRQGVRTSDAQTDRRFEPGESIIQAGIREAMCVPMPGRLDTLGAVYVDITVGPERSLLDLEHRQKFTDEHLRMLLAIGRHIALAIENFHYRQSLLKAERLAAMGQTIAMLSHHIKNILQGIRGGSYLIDMGLKQHDEEFIRKGWDIVEKNQGKIYHLVMDMLSYSKDRQPDVEPSSLTEIVKEVVQLMESRATECDVVLKLVSLDDIPESMFDAEAIHRAVLNIVLNAIEAVEGCRDALVEVQAAYDSQSDTLFVKVGDNGPGIPEAQLKKIFQVFESTKGTRGTGLGLAVSRKILREHGGEISVESTQGKGSEFLLAWPKIAIGETFTETQTQT